MFMINNNSYLEVIGVEETIEEYWDSLEVTDGG